MTRALINLSVAVTVLLTACIALPPQAKAEPDVAIKIATDLMSKDALPYPPRKPIAPKPDRKPKTPAEKAAEEKRKQEEAEQMLKAMDDAAAELDLLRLMSKHPAIWALLRSVDQYLGHQGPI